MSDKPITNEASPTDAAILAALVTGAWQAIVNDPDIGPFRRIDALTAKIPDLCEAAGACRMAMTIIEPDSHPDAVRSRAARNAEIAAAKAAKAAERSRVIETRLIEKSLVEAVTTAQAAHDRAAKFVERYSRPGSEVDDERKVLAAGALAQADAALDVARKSLDAHRAGTGKAVLP